MSAWSLERVALGHSGLRPTRLGAGCWPAGGAAYNLSREIGWTTSDTERSREALQYALACGINHFDVADAYGFGKAERLLGGMLEGANRASLLVSGKVGYIAGSAPNAYHPRQMSTQLANSLDNLGTEYLDIYSFHNLNFGPDDRFLCDAADLMQQWKAQGIVRAVGMRALHEFTGNTGPQREAAPDRFESLAEVLKPDIVQVRFNLFADPTPVRRIAQWATKRGVGLVINKPLAQGLIFDKYSPDAPPTFGRGDHRTQKIEFRSPGLNLLRQRLRLMLGVLGASRADLPRIALGYALSVKPDACAVVGFTDWMQLKQNLGAAALMNAADVELIEQSMSGLPAELRAAERAAVAR